MGGCRLTSIGDLAGISTGRLVTELRHGGSDLEQTLEGGSITRTLVPGQGDGLLLAGLGILDLGGDGDDLVVEPAGLLGDLGTPEALDGVFVLLSSRDVEVVADVLGGLDHGLFAVGGFLVGVDFGGENGPVARRVRHAFAAECDADVDAAGGDLARNVLHCFEPGRAESVHGAGSRGVWEARGQHGGADFVCGTDVADISEADVLDQRGVDLALLDELLQQGVDDVVEVGVLEAALLALGEWRSQSECDDDVVGILLCAGRGKGSC